jgi:hypothetical protein
MTYSFNSTFFLGVGTLPAYLTGMIVMRTLILFSVFLCLATSGAWSQVAECSQVYERPITCSNSQGCHQTQYASMCTFTGPYMCYYPCGYGLCCGQQYSNACYSSPCLEAPKQASARLPVEIARLYVPDRCRGHFSLIEAGDPLWHRPPKSTAKPPEQSAN